MPARSRRALPSAGMLLYLLLAGSCGSQPDMAGPGGAAARLDIQELPVLTLNPGGEHEIRVRALLGDGREMSLPTVTWSSSDPGRVTVDGEGRILGLTLGQAWVYASAPGIPGDSVSVWVERPSSEPSRFEITLVFTDDVPDRWQEALEIAAARWQQVIRDTLPAADIAMLQEHCGSLPGQARPNFAGLESGVRIWVNVSRFFPPGTFVEAVGGPCRHRGLPHPTTVLGEITLNAAHFSQPIDPSRLEYVAHHEMGHTLGIAGVVQGFQPPWLDAAAGLLRGHLTLDGARRMGRFRTQIDVSDGSHWPINIGGLMGVGGRNVDQITPVSVGMLMDFGYPAAWYGAGPL